MNNSFFYNGRGSLELTDRILSLIQDAELYIKTGNFLFQDVRVVEALIEAMGRGVAVFILSNTTQQENDSRPGRVEGHVDLQLPNLKELTRKGAHCRALDDLHAKFLIVDGQDGLLMSANFSPNSIEGNIETGVLLKEDEVADLEFVFDNLYMNADVQRIFGTDSKTAILRSKKPLPSETFSREHIKSNLRLTIVGQERKGRQSNLANCNVMTLYQEILNIISRAKERIDIVTWHFSAIDNLPELVQELRSAIARGVKVRLYSNHVQDNTSLPESLKCIASLKQFGCEHVGDGQNHSKAVITEGEGIILTANIDGNHGLKGGFEVGCVLKGERLEEMRTFVESLFV